MELQKVPALTPPDVPAHEGWVLGDFLGLDLTSFQADDNLPSRFPYSQQDTLELFINANPWVHFCRTSTLTTMKGWRQRTPSSGRQETLDLEARHHEGHAAGPAAATWGGAALQAPGEPRTRPDQRVSRGGA